MYHDIARHFKIPLYPGFSGHGKPGEVNHFWALDSPELYEKNLKLQPENWIYRNKTLTYTTNKSGYRAPEWSDIDWTNSILVLGCSYVFGDGVDDKETIPYYIEQYTKIPTINLGHGAAGQLLLLHNSIIIKENFGIPKAIVFIWPNQSRSLKYINYHPIKEGAWGDIKVNSFFDHYNRDNNAEAMCYFNRLLAKNMWENLTIFYDISYSDDVTQITGCDDWPLEARRPNNHNEMAARDLVHQNHIANSMVADKISKNLIGRGL